MPTIVTFGAMSARAFGFGASNSYGTFGIFQLGYHRTCAQVTTRNKYTYATCAQTSATAASAASFGGTAVGNATRGIFNLNDPTLLKTTNKYTYVCSTSVAGSCLNTNASGNPASAGNATRGIIQGTSSATNKYTYACDVSSAGSALTCFASIGQSAGMGTSTAGIFTKMGNTTTRKKFTYATDVVTAATAAGKIGVSSGGAAGNSTRGIFAYAFIHPGCCDVASRARCKYTYACDTNASATNAAACATVLNNYASGNSTRGIFKKGDFTATCKYTYACDTNTCGGSLSANSSNGMAASNGIVGVNA